ncbi:MAG: ATP-dependent zinc metalloprotease FtsH [Clostridiales bacterium]|jgi:cell division protease FtsH|nr:ATP-dependent zinc metalloprotease FtsH [Clostridiales bacterium]MDD2572293.1 ATP-dependent zinc metalloprotease FtsH [Eubacteriales bacterium]MDD3539934.1 ATP-dependent zinc metalloprotease FtsH [Eubacteriales bacterium]MDY0119171.1 ATP-dependent zinc metalloprotease FtsH [Clostridia bacterium]
MNGPQQRKFGGFSFYVILMIAILAVTLMMSRSDKVKDTSLFEVEEMIRSGQVESVTIDGATLNLTMTEEAVKAGSAATVKKDIPTDTIDSYLSILRQAKAEGQITSFDYNRPTDFGGILNGVIMLLMMVSLGAFVFISYARRDGEGKSAMSFGKSRATLADPAQNRVTFDDVAGAEEEKDELQEVVDFLKSPKKYQELGAKIPKGILLVGPPGTGKTLLARAVAGEAQVPFYSISGSDFVEMFVGVGASRVRNLFLNAKKKAPCIVFIDEIDAVGRHRGAGLGGGHDEREQTLNQLLVEMDGFGPNEGVIVLAATNRPDILDNALLRPGRFDRRIMVMSPDLKGRAAILAVHAKGKPFDDDVNLEEIAKITPGFTGADLANLLNEAALLAARRNDTKIHYSDISEAVFKVTIGPEKKSRVINEEERKLTAFHESGHAIILREVSTTDRVERVSIIPAGAAGGYTAYKPNEDIYFKTKTQLIAEIMMALGGRAAEDIVFNEISTGAGADLKECNRIARAMVTKYGMSTRLGNVITNNDDEVFIGRDYGHVRNHSESLQGAVDEEIARILDESYAETKQILTENRVLLDALAGRLLEKEKIESAEFEAVYQEYAVDPKPLPGEGAVDIALTPEEA